ncbi:transposase [Paenibacillus alba]|nr:transposase [Paenibacillus alba]
MQTRTQASLYLGYNETDSAYSLSVRRMVEPESAFGEMQNNRGFRRFLLRGFAKVSLEVGWRSLAHVLK